MTTLYPSITFTPEELEKITQLRQRITADTELLEEQSTDHYLIRWLRARGMDLSKAEEMLRKTLKWRKDNGIDTILETMKMPRHIEERMPLAYLGMDPVSSCPVLLYLMGRFDLRSFLEEVGSDMFMRYNFYVMEYVVKVICKECSEKAGRPITQFIELCDLEYYSYRQLANSHCRDMIIKLQHMLDNNYPEVIFHMSLVNAPRVFYFIYNIVKPLVAKATMDKITVYGPTNWKEEIKSQVPMDLLPTHWGGTRAGRDEFCSGDPIWFMGLVKDYFKELKVIKVKARGKVRLDFEISEEGSILTWKFKSDSYDICFGILHEEIEILPVKRVDSHKEIQTGEMECKSIGTYTIVFDNTHSYTREKNVHHWIEIQRSFTSIIS